MALNQTGAVADGGKISQRLYSLDALRGFDMFWIMGAEEIFKELFKATGSPFWGAIAGQLSHPAWHGFAMYDSIFPLFLFIAGAATPFSVGREMEKGKTKGQLLARVIKRGLILVLLGVIYNNGLEIQPISEIRFGSVLGRIGLAYMFANIIYIYTKKFSTQAIWFASILIGYWLLLKFNSAPGFATGDLTMEGNFASYIDRSVLPGRLYLKIHDPEGLTSTIPAIATGLLGIMAGSFLKNSPLSGSAKSARLAIAGVISIGLALLWNLDFPINKNLWTSSFVLTVGGYSLIMLGLFYFIIDVKGYKKWAFFFKIIGMNSILIYLSERFINWEYTTDGLFHWVGQIIGSPFAPVAMAICYVGVKWAFLYFMYNKKVFLRV
jgi:predicted acyltransferase